MAITTAQYKAAVEAKIAAATGSTSLDDLTLIKSNADLWLQNNPGGSITGYSSLESLIQTKQNALTGSSTLDDITLTGVSVFPPVSASAIKSFQTGFINSNAPTLGTANTEDRYYVDVTISAVDTAKCFVQLQGQALVETATSSVARSNPWRTFRYNDGTNFYINFLLSARLLNSTTLRVSLWFNSDTPDVVRFLARWSILELN